MDELVVGFKHQKQYALSDDSSDISHDVAESSASMNFTSDGNQYALNCISDLKSIAGIGPEWMDLEQTHSEPYTYFQSYDWCYRWCELFGFQDDGKNTQDIRIYTLRCNGELMMVWPMMVVKSRAGTKNLTFLSEPHGQYSNVIVNKSKFSLETGKKVWDYIRNHTNADAITLDQYPKSSFLSEVIDGGGYVENSKKYSSILNLKNFGTWDEYRASLPRKQRKQRKQRHNKLAKQGEVGYEVHFGGSQKYRELVDLALRWKIEWLSQTGRRATVLSTETTKTFLSNLSGNNNSIPHGVVLGALTLDGKPIGIEIGMCLNGHYYSYLGAFDWQHSKLSPGKIQMEFAQKWAKEAGLEKFDFLGDPADYKSTWTDTEGELESRSFPITIRGYIYCIAWKAYLRPWARSTFNRLDADKRARLLRLLGLGEKGISTKTDANNGVTKSVIKTSTANNCAANK